MKMIYRFFITAQAGLPKKAKETSVIENDIQIFYNCASRTFQKSKRNFGYINKFQKIRPYGRIFRFSFFILFLKAQNLLFLRGSHGYRGKAVRRKHSGRQRRRMCRYHGFGQYRQHGKGDISALL